MENIKINDHRERYCPMLGHELTFAYCRTTGTNIPCRRIFDCWWEIFDIQSFMESNFDTVAIKEILSPPPPKTVTLLDLIRKAQNSNK